MTKERKETEVTLQISTLKVTENLAYDPQGFMIRAFLSCSRADTRTFKIHSNITSINETLKIKNISPKEIEFWLCTSYNKIIAVGFLSLSEENIGPFSVEIKLLNTDFGTLEGNVDLRTYSIYTEKIIEPDEELLKKVEKLSDKKSKEELEEQKVRESIEAQEAKNEKRHAITLTRFNKKDEPFI